MLRTVADLNGSDWRLGRAPDDALPGQARWGELDRVAEWLPAQVPGNIQADLVDAGQLEDPVRAFDARAFREVGERSWWLVRDFQAEPGPNRRARIGFRGIDYVGDVFFNGHHLGRHEGMFSPHEYEVTGLLRPENRLAVRLLGSRWLPRDRSTAWEKLLNRIEARWGGLPGDYPDRRDTLKCQMQFGWDFAPPLLTMGLWDDVYMATSGRALIGSIRTAFHPAQPCAGAGLVVGVEIAGEPCGSLRLVVRLEDEASSGERLEIERRLASDTGSGQFQIEVPVPRPRLWWPWDHGEPHLYRLTVEAWDGDLLLDSRCRPTGLRSIEFEEYALRVNGRPVFARGANWVPAGLFPGRVSAQEYSRLLGMARQANMNMLRIWGGGLREKQAFYDECDRLGILVWQEFPFACAFLTRFPRSEAYLGLVREEAGAIVRDLRHHACLAAWSGGNEFSPDRNAPLVGALRQVVSAEDPGRPFLPASPFRGDHHNWLVWHSFLPPSAYLQDDARFASELGLQSPPGVESLRNVLPRQQCWPPGEAWALRGAGIQKLWRYARPYLPPPHCDRRRPAWSTLAQETFVQASQQAQLQGLKVAIEHFRRRKAAGCGGILVWQLNEPWPAISWALIAYAGEVKPAYRALRGLFAPVLVSLAFPPRRYTGGDGFSAEAWVVNDTPEALTGCELAASLYDGDGRQIECVSQRVDVAAASAAAVARVRWLLPRGNRWVATCHLSRGGEVVAANQYDLALHDDIEPTLMQQLWTWLTRLVTRL